MYPERRKAKVKIQDCLAKLSIPQEIALVKAFQLGYSLEFTRKTKAGVLAVACRANSLLTIDQCGIANYNPEIKVRH